MPVLNSDGTIEYNSPGEFLADYDTNISKGGLYLATEAHWPLRRSRSFNIQIKGMDASATIRAEIVFTGQGKAGLQIQRSPGNQTAISDLLDKVKAFLAGAPESAPTAASKQKGITLLKEDGTIFFGSGDDFAGQCDSMLSTYNLYLDTSSDWPLHQSRRFDIQIDGTDASASIQAQAVFGGQGKIGLQIDKTTQNQEAIAGLLARIQGSQAGPAPEAEAEPVAETSAEPQAPPAEEISPDALEFQGQIVVTRDASELRSAEPVGIGSDACRSISLLQLIASITTSGLPLALTIVCRGKQLSFRFNSKGNLVQFLSPDAGEDLIERLGKKQLLTKARQQEVLGELGKDKTAEAVLLQKQYVKLNDLWDLIRDQVVDSFEQIQASGGAPYQINAINTGRKTGVAFGDLVIPWMERLLDSIDPDRITTMLKPLWDMYITAKEKPKWPLDSFAFDSRGERFVNDYLDGLRTLSEAMDVYPIRYRDKASRLVLILKAIGLVEVLDNPLGDEDVTPEGRLARELEKLDKKSLFHQAGIHWSSHIDDYPAAMKKLEKRYGSSSKLARRSPECGRLCDKRLQMARKAMQVLKDAARRKEHRRAVVGDYQMKNSAELLFRQALLQLLKNDVKKARELLEVAIELDPVPEYIHKLKSL